jgi:hypothetical protein
MNGNWDKRRTHDLMLEPLRDPVFWTNTLQIAKTALAAAVDRADQALDEELDELARLDPDGEQWPVYGALIVNLRNILESLDVVATVQPVVVSP